ncbi:MAG TPA: hypothetical protein VGJ87_08875, partial [Roseiflexaceae bacterium]
LAAIRAANAAKAAGAPADVATTSPSAPAPASATGPTTPLAAPAAVAPKPVTRAPAAPARKPIPRVVRMLASIVFFSIVSLLLATTTHEYVAALIFGVLFGATFSWMFGSWPPGPGDDVTSGGE